MNDQSNGQATNADPTAGGQSNVLNEGNWTVERLPYTEDPPQRAFFSYALIGDSTNVYNRSLRRTPV
jgi:hypothetical protein